MRSLRFRFFDDLVIAYLPPNLVIILDTSRFISLSLLYMLWVCVTYVYSEKQNLLSFGALWSTLSTTFRTIFYWVWLTPRLCHRSSQMESPSGCKSYFLGSQMWTLVSSSSNSFWRKKCKQFCITLWLTNLIYQFLSESRALSRQSTGVLWECCGLSSRNAAGDIQYI